MNREDNKMRNRRKNKRKGFRSLFGILGASILLYGLYLFEGNLLEDARASEREQQLQEDEKQDLEDTSKLKVNQKKVLEKITFLGFFLGNQLGDWKQETTNFPLQTALTEEEKERCKQHITELEQSLEDRIKTTAFVGNSMIESLQEHNRGSKAKFICYKGLSVKSAKKKEWLKLNNSRKGTVLDVLKEDSYTDIFMMFGINELGWRSLELFRDYYVELIEEVKKLQPDAKIYILSIFPVTQKTSEVDKTFNNDNVKIFNDMVIEAAQKAEVEYLDIASELFGKGNPLPADGAISDGIHLKKDYCQIWYETLLEKLSAQ